MKDIDPYTLILSIAAADADRWHRNSASSAQPLDWPIDGDKLALWKAS